MDKNSDIVKTGTALCETCQRSGRQNLAETFCVQCQEYMCRQCSDHHFLLPMTKQHRLIWNTEMPLHKVSTSLAEFCSVHSGEICHFYCKTHNALICYMCNTSIHKNCRNKHQLSELSHDIVISEKFLKTRAEVKEMLQLFSTLKTQLVSSLHAARAKHDYSAQVQQTTSLDNSEQIQNLINTHEEYRNIEADEICRLLYQCDTEIHKADTLNTDLDTLQRTQQHVQLHIALQNALQVLPHMTAIYKEIVSKNKQNTHAILIIEEPVPIPKDEWRGTIKEKYPRPTNEFERCKLWMSVFCFSYPLMFFGLIIIIIGPLLLLCIFG